MEEVHALRTEFETTLLKSQLEIQEQTFQNISYEIHDNIGQILSLARLNINTLKADGQEQKLDDTDLLLERAINDLRYLSHSLNANHLIDIGLAKATETLLRNMQRSGAFLTKFENNVQEIDLSGDHTIILYRMIQELVNNIIKHAKAKVVSVYFDGGDRLRQIKVIDDGVGFNNVSSVSGMGLSAILTRSKAINAIVSFDTAPGNGTIVNINLTKKEV